MTAKKTRDPTKTPEPDMDRLADAVRRVARTAGPDLKTEVKWGNPWFVGTDLILLVGAFTRHVGIEFWRGTSLRDPQGLLEGTGKNLRHVKVRTLAEAKSPALAALFREAIRLDAVEPRRAR
jgi:hypothetical protein